MNPRFQPVPAPLDNGADTDNRAQSRHQAEARSTSRPVPPIPERRYALTSELTPLGALKSAPGVARAHLRDTLEQWQMTAYEEVAELLTSELVTNAVLASTDEYGYPIYINGRMAVVIFRILAYPNSLVLESWDLVPTAPVMRMVNNWDEHGRGLLLVDALASRWDWKTARGWPGKCVWAEL